MARFVTFSFDDGMIDTARRAKSLNVPMTFYIVLGWTLKSVEIDDFYNRGLEHGSIRDWTESGFDIGCHTYNHSKNFDEFFSFQKFSRFFGSPRNLATPYGIDHVTKAYDSCKVGFYQPFNDLTEKSMKRLSSINPIFDLQSKDDLRSIARNCPEGRWIILTFHGIDEGWCPITHGELESLIELFSEYQFTFMTVSDGVRKACRKYLL